MVCAGDFSSGPGCGWGVSAGLVGGVYGIRIAGYLKQAREKSKALKEIVTGNELFKQLYPEQADRFKESQQKQSPATQKLVTELKTS